MAGSTWPPPQAGASARSVVLMVHRHGGPASVDEEWVEVALHGRAIDTLDVALPARGDSSAALRALQAALDQVQAEAGAVPTGLCADRDAAAVVLAAAARQPERQQAIVLLGAALEDCGVDFCAVRTPTLMVVGPGEYDTLAGNRRACSGLGELARLEVLPREGHVFAASELGSRKAELAADWFARHLAAAVPAAARERSARPARPAAGSHPA